MSEQNTKTRKPHFQRVTEPFRDYEKYIDFERGLSKEKYWQIMNNCKSRVFNDTIQGASNYVGCSLAPEWSGNREPWVQWIHGNFYILPTGEPIALDKDILVKGNKVYGPDTCLFVPQYINKFFEPNCGKAQRKYDLPRGVYFQNGKYFSSIVRWGESKEST